MKKIVCTLTLLITLSTQAFGFEHYMLLSDKPITNLEVKNPEIVSVEIINSNNYKEQTMFVNPKQTGSTCIRFCKGRKNIKLWIKVFDERTCIKKCNGIKTVPIDIPKELR